MADHSHLATDRAARFRPLDHSRTADRTDAQAATGASEIQRQDLRGVERFQAKACPGLDPGWIPVRVKKTRQNKKIEREIRASRSQSDATNAWTENIRALSVQDSLTFQPEPRASAVKRSSEYL